MDVAEYDYIIVGTGFAGSVLAERIASQLDKKVLLLDRRSHIGGNCYDEYHSSGVLVHKYGPHLFHTDNDQVYSYLSEFTSWNEYIHEVVADVDSKIIPIPFNINTLYEVFKEEKAYKLEKKLLSEYGENQKIPILELMKTNDAELQELGEYVYNKIFVNYTAKQWGKNPDEIDAAVTARVPILTSRDNRYFGDKYQAIPKNGYTKLFENMLKNKNIHLKLNIEASSIMSIQDNVLYCNDEKFKGKLIFTGMIDELFNNIFGLLPYRSIDLKFETVEKEFYQDYAVINYPNQHQYTRITEFKYFHPVSTQKTVILKEYPKAYRRNQNTPFYPLFTNVNEKKYTCYADNAKKISNLYLVGRLAEYKYYDMDDIVKRALDMFDNEIRPIETSK